jgi:hypothetical protein
MVHQKTKSEINWLAISFFSLALFFSAGIVHAQGASFSFSTQAGSYGVGNIISATVYLNASQPVNAISGVISFPNDKLAVSSISQAGSIVNLWVQNPSFSNTAGTITFQGVILNPGYTGSGGNIVTINFKATAPGIALVSFTSGSILANDGQGTNILDPNGLPSNQYAINVPTGAVANGSISTPSGTSGPQAPIISSPTHPSPTKWYASSNADLVWNIPAGVDAVRLLYNKYPNSTPTVLYEPPVGEKELTGLQDGIWYFHAQFHDQSGWGSIAHFKLQIDTTPPEPFQISFAENSDPTNPRPAVILNATDTISGIADYKIKVDDQNFITIPASQAQSGPYALPIETNGAHTIVIQAFDQAGNYQTAIGQFTVAPITPPTITNYTTALRQGDLLVVKGTTYPNATVNVELEGQGTLPKTWNGVSDGSGAFTVTGDGAIAPGAYKMYATVTDSRGAQSPPTQKYDVVVSPGTFLGIGTYTISLITVVILFIFILTLAAAALWYSMHKMRALKKGIAKEAQTVERDVERAFKALKTDIRDHIRYLEKIKSLRELTREENILLKQMKDDLDRSEKSIENDLDKIEKHLK